jgi:flagellar biosynthesis protein FlhA
MGFIIPAVHIRDNLQLKPNRYAFYLKGVEIAGGELMMGHYLAITNDETDAKIPGIKTHEPAFGLPALWIPESQKEDAQAKGYVIVDPATVITTHLTEVIKSQADELVGRQEVQALVDNLASHYPKIVEELVPKVIPIGILQRVLQRLLKERVSIRDLFAILETLADYITITKNVDILTGYVRQGLSRTITRQYQDQDGNVNVMMLSPNIEDTISQSIQHTELESFVSPDPNMVKKLITSLQKGIAHFETSGLNPIILCSPLVRGHLRKILEKFIPNVVVLAHNEITRDVNIKSFGVVEL